MDDVARLMALAEDLQALDRLEGHPTRGTAKVELRRIGQETLLQLSETASGKGVQLELLPGRPATLQGDSLQLARLLRNLVENALRVSPPSAKVEVEVGQHGNEVKLVVLDRGPGVAPAIRRRLFEPLMRLQAGPARGPGGSGLGLAIAREIARVHGGDLTYEARPGGGARFVAILREADPNSAAK